MRLSTGALTDPEVRSVNERAAEFVLASTNVDEDPHFSTLYLESTLAPPSLGGGWPAPARWYSELIALNRQGLERYYLRRSECEAVSRSLTEAVLGEPSLLIEVLREVDRRARRLETAFPRGWLTSPHAAYDLPRLVDIYRRHLDLHQHLYAVARLPEALDRGTGEFTARLNALIRERPGTGDAPLDALMTLSATGRPSMFRQEQLEFARLAASLSAPERSAIASARSAAIASMALGPAARRELGHHRQRWAPLFYHGYGKREAVPVAELAARLQQVVRKGVGSVAPDVPDVAARESLARRLRLSKRERLAFRAYGLLGWTKAQRRWFQLRNFQRLDLLIERLSQRLDCSEWDLRVLLPSEVIRWAETGERPDEAIAMRYEGVTLWFRGRDLRVADIPASLKLDMPSGEAPSSWLGESTVPGRVTGRCVLATRGVAAPPDEDAGCPQVLVASQLDSDLVWTLPFYDGLVVEEQGASAHVAIIAREIGIPTVAGVHDVTRRLSSGDWITVDGDGGEVHRGSPASVPLTAVPSAHV